MLWLTPALVATLTATTLLAAAYLYLWRQEREAGTGVLAAGWGLYAARFACMLWWVQPGASPAWLAASLLLALWASLFLLWGALLLAGRGLTPWWWAAAAVVSLWTPAAILAGAGFVTLTLPVFAAAGLANLHTGLVWLRQKEAEPLARRAGGWAFLLWGLHKLDYPFLRPVAWFAPWGYLLGAMLEMVASLALILVLFGRAKRRAAASESFLRLMADSLPQLIAYVDRGRRYRFVNAQYQQWFGVPPGQLLGRRVEDLLGPEQAEAIRPRQERALAGEAVTYESVLTLPDGSQLPYYARYLPDRRPDGSVPGYFVLVEDVSERRRAEEELRRSEERLAKAFRATPVWMTITTVEEGRFLEVNDAFCAISGLSRQEALSSTAFELGFWVEARERRQAVEEVRDKGRLRERRVRLGFRDGVHTMLWSAEPMEYEGQACLLNVMLDVTERYRAQEELKASQEYLKALVDGSTDAILGLDTRRRVLTANPAFFRQLGYAPEQVVGRDTALLHVSPEKHQEFGEMVYPAVERRGSWRGEWSFRRADGQVVPMETVVSALHDPEGRTTGFVAVLRDVSPRRQAEAERAQLEARLLQAQKMEAIGTLAGGIAHDFNNILAAILGYTELVADGLPESGEARENLDQVLKAGERARELVKQILTFSRQSEQERRPVRLATVVGEVLRLLRSSLPTTIEIRRDLASGDGVVLADPTQVHQVLMNLCTNAAQAMEPGGGWLTVSLASREVGRGEAAEHRDVPAGAYQVLSVADTGRGMSPTELAKIFEPYYTTKPAGEGTGLGLAVVHGIVRAHGGWLQVDSAPGRGSTFRVYLPEAGEEAREEPHTLHNLPRGEERVLLVDDEKALVELGRQTLERLGYTVDTFTNSQEALAALQRRPADFDVVITDQTMPRLTGLELAAAAREIKPGLPVLLCTGFSRTVDDRSVRQAGVRQVLMKPLVARDLAQAVREALDDSGLAGRPAG
jgi:PAS domain S-box-containing protein